jgi:hypothetical protein
MPRPASNAWNITTVWGAPRDVNGQNIVWGTLARDGENIVWGTTVLDTGSVLGLLSLGENIVWGTTRTDENIVWGTLRDAENIVWGTTCGSDDCFNIVWGTTLRDAENIVWGTSLVDENIVWGTSGDVGNVTWASSDETTEPVLFDDTPVAVPSFDSLFPPPPVDVDPITGGGL